MDPKVEVFGSTPAGARPEAWVPYELAPESKQLFRLDAFTAAMDINRDVERPPNVYVSAIVGVKDNKPFFSPWIRFDVSKTLENHEETDN